MSEYTIQLRFICEKVAGYDYSVGYMSVHDIIKSAVPKIFDFSYPIFNEEHRATLQEKIIKHFYFREIGFETYALWKFHLERKLNEIMPYYNQLYKSELLEFDPLGDTNIVSETIGDSRATGRGTANSSNTAKMRHSETPQGGLQDVMNDRYLTTADYNNGDNTSDSSTETESADHVVRTLKGKTGSSTNYSDLLVKYRKTFLNIDKQIIDELESLFMQIW